MASCSSAGQQGAAALNLGLAPLSHRAPWADQDDQHTVLGFWEYGAGTDPSAELVGKRLRRVRGPGEGGGSDSIRLELEDGSRYAVRMRGAARACRYSRYEVGFRAGVAPDEASCCTAWCGTAGGPPAPRIEDAALLLVADASPIVWDAGRRTDSGHVELGIKFDCDPAWYRVQGKVRCGTGDAV